MKTRMGFVSNSSSSSFIIPGSTEQNHNLLSILSSNVWFYFIECHKDKIPNCLNDLREEFNQRFIEPNECYNNKSYYEMLVGDEQVRSMHKLEKLFDIAKRYGCTIRICTGSTSSDIEPQLMVQSCLIDMKVNYSVCGDGSFDLRKIDHIAEMEFVMNECNYEGFIGPCRVILEHYKTLAKN